MKSLRELIQRLEMYEATRTRHQEKEEDFVLALKRWLDGEDDAIDEWLRNL